MAITKADVIDAMGELTDALVAFSDRIDREVELILRADGTASLMGAEEGTAAGETATGFVQLEEFDSIGELWTFLQMAEPERCPN